MKKILEILETSTSNEKIKILETLDSENNPEILEEMIQRLNDDSIQVRGEAFSSLVLNENEISKLLIKNLNSSNKNIRGFTLLILANRNEKKCVPEITNLVNDENSMVRSCALGALGHLKSKESKDILIESLLDSDLEVKKSALQAIIDLDITIPEDKIKKISKEKDDYIQKMIIQLRKK